jgi:hypothetical protein
MRCFAGVALLVLAGLAARGTGNGPMLSCASDSEARVPVVVELFTSEGCSSCPPADSFLAELERQQPYGRAEVIALEEHVDYWDQQGWVDPFSSSSWTSRQFVYSGALGNGNPYTPQMVVDGTEEFVGSHILKARQAIETAAAAKKTKVSVNEVSPIDNKAVTFSVEVEKVLSSTPGDTPEVIFAVTEAGLYSKVSAGENSGKVLHHAPVLRELKVIGAADRTGSEAFTAQRTVKLNSSWKAENLRAVVFVQEKKSRHILGAAGMLFVAEDSKPR